MSCAADVRASSLRHDYGEGSAVLAVTPLNHITAVNEAWRVKLRLSRGPASRPAHSHTPDDHQHGFCEEMSRIPINSRCWSRSEQRHRAGEKLSIRLHVSSQNIYCTTKTLQQSSLKLHSV